MTQVKDVSVLRAIMSVPAHHILLDFLTWFDDAHPNHTFITDGYRPGDTGCHGTIPLRAIDLRSQIFLYPMAIERDINRNWEYDPKRPGKKVCLFHRVKNGGYHFHIQVHDNTVRKQTNIENVRD